MTRPFENNSVGHQDIAKHTVVENVSCDMQSRCCKNFTIWSSIAQVHPKRKNKDNV